MLKDDHEFILNNFEKLLKSLDLNSLESVTDDSMIENVKQSVREQGKQIAQWVRERGFEGLAREIEEIIKDPPEPEPEPNR